MWAIATGEPPDDLRKWRDAFDIELPILHDPDGSVSRLYETTIAFPTGAYPQTSLIDRDGIIVLYENTYDSATLEAAVSGL